MAARDMFSWSWRSALEVCETAFVRRPRRWEVTKEMMKMAVASEMTATGSFAFESAGTEVEVFMIASC